MADLTTSRIPREQLVGLLADTSDQRERITAPMPAARLDELLGNPEEEAEAVAQGSTPDLLVNSSPELVVRFKPATKPAISSHHIILWSFALTVLVGALVIFLV